MSENYTFEELAKEYSERLRLCEPVKRLTEVNKISKEIDGLKQQGKTLPKASTRPT